MKQIDVLIAGTGHAAAQAAIAVRQLGFTGTIEMTGPETDPPYERPPLSKEYLAGEKDFERLLIRPVSFWQQKQVSIRTHAGVETVDPQNRTVRLSDGTSLRYGELIWATGGHARRLSCAGHDLDGVHSVRSCSDVDKLRAELTGADRIAIVGGGYIGLEVAAVLRKMKKDVTVVEAQNRLLARVAGETLSRFYEAEHRGQGVHILLDQTVDCIEESHGRCSGVRLKGGDIIPADIVVVGIGIVPLTEPLLAAGARGGNGVAVDEFCRTSLEHIYAIGDCALHENVFANGRPLRVESIQNATDMAAAAAKAIIGKPEPYRSVPWFWSNQYDLRLQTMGLSIDHEDSVVRGDPHTRSFSVIYRRDGRVIALDCVNAAKDYVQGRALVESGIRVEPGALADTRVPLKSHARSGTPT